MDVVAYRFKDGERYDQSTAHPAEKWFDKVSEQDILSLILEGSAS